MKNCHFICSLIVLTVLTFRLSAQDKPYTLVVDFDKKVLNVDQLSLPGSFSAAGLLSMLPELLQRPGQTLSNYEIKLEGMSLGDVSDASLLQIHLEDLDKIEVDESPVSAYQNNGQGGSINFVLRSKPRNESRCTWGKASIDALCPTDLTPNFQINYQRDKWTVRNIAIGQYYAPDNQRFWSELGRSYIKYKPTAKDEFELDLSETVSRNSLDGEQSSSSFTKNVSLQAIAKYSHTFNAHANFKAELQYQFTPNSDGLDNTTQHINNRRHGHYLSGKAEFTCNLLPRESRNFLELNAGVSTNQNFTNEDLKDYMLPYSYNFIYDTDAHINYFMPFATFTGDMGRFRFKATAEYQHYEYNVQQSDYPNQTLSHNDFTCKAMFCWQMCPHQHLRLIFDRELQRPSNDQIYPYLRYSASQSQFIMGSLNLSPTLMDEVSLDYISDYHWGDHNLTLNAGIGYTYVDDIISTTNGSSQIDLPDATALSLPYQTYLNSGTNHLTVGRMMALYSHSIFSLSFSGNVINNRKHLPSGKDYYTSYNLSFLPALNFKNGFTTAVNLVYVSKVNTVSSELGDCTYGQLSLGKNWSNLSLYLYGKSSLSGKAKDKTGDSIREYDLVQSSCGLGLSYRF